MKKIASYSRYFLLSALVLVLAIFASRQAAAATCATVTPSMSTSQIQSAINNCPAGDTLEFAGGTYTITAGLRYSVA
jgi:polygalacturonase